MHVSYFGMYVELLSVECECRGGIISEEVLRSGGRLFISVQYLFIVSC